MIEKETMRIIADAFKDRRVAEADALGLPMTDRMRGTLKMDVDAAYAALTALNAAGYMVVPMPADHH
jgi:hypothetical protein